MGLAVFVKNRAVVAACTIAAIVLGAMIGIAGVNNAAVPAPNPTPAPTTSS